MSGDVALSVTISALSTLVGVFATPLLTRLYVDASIAVDVHGMLMSILQIVALPIVVGLIINHLFSKTVRKIDILFTIGGDGTQRGANDLHQKARKRGHALSVVGVPKTIDNDVGFVSRTFGFFSAVEEAKRAIDCAHTEACSVRGGISLVKLMGRHAGFITAGAVVANVQPGSPADNAGLERGDVILEVNRHKVQNASDVQKALRNVPAGQDALVLVWSNGGNTFRVLHSGEGA